MSCGWLAVPSCEVWKPLWRSRYDVSSRGRIRVGATFEKTVLTCGCRGWHRRSSPQLLKPFQNDEGYLKIKLSINGHRRTFSVARLVLTVFTRWPKPGEEACHRNGSRTNNSLSNLYWGRRPHQHADKLRAGTHAGWKRPLDDTQLSTILSTPWPPRVLARELGVGLSTVRDVRSGRRAQRRS